MKIQSINKLLFLLLAIIMILSYLFINNEFRKHQLIEKRNNRIDILVSNLYDLSILSNEVVVLFKKNRYDLWLKKHKDINNQIKKLIEVDKETYLKYYKKLQRVNSTSLRVFNEYQSFVKKDLQDDNLNFKSYIDIQASNLLSLSSQMNKIILVLKELSAEDTKEINSSIQNVILIILFIFISYFISSFFLILKRIVSPLANISREILKYNKGDSSLKIDKKYNDELGVFIDAFNKMIEKRKEWETELKELNITLEEKVQFQVNEITKQTRLYEKIINTSNDAIILIDKDYKYLIANERYLDIHKIKRDEIIGKKHFDILAKNKLSKSTKKSFDKVLNGKDLTYEKWISTQAKEKLLVEVHMTSYVPNIKDGKIEGIISTIRDKTKEYFLQEEHKRQEQLLLQQAKLAAMGEMIGAIAHQWRQPLSVIGGTLINIEEAYEYGELDQKTLRRYIDSSEKNLLFMSKTIDDFRNFFEPSKKKMNFSIQKVTMNAMSIVSSQMQDNNISLKLEIDTGIGIEIIEDFRDTDNISNNFIVSGYPNEFTQVLVNLFANSKDAIFASLKNKSLINGDGQIILNISLLNEYIIIKVKDNAGGIPKNIIQRVFEPYFTTKDEGKGTGIGLYMSKMIIEENMDGQITVNNIDDGAVFMIKLKKVSNA